MIVPEHKAKEQLARYGIAVPKGSAVTTQAEAHRVAQEVGGKCAVKALIPLGGRGKAGGVKICSTADEASTAAQQMLGMTLRDYVVEEVLVEEALSITDEYYAAVLVNQDQGSVDILFSLNGGMDVEELAEKAPESIWHLQTQAGRAVPVHEVRTWLMRNGIEDASALAHTLACLHRFALDSDAMLLEINPLIKCADDSLAALDCKLDIDESALYRQPVFSALQGEKLSPLEEEAKRLGVSFVSLDGDVGVIASGAGLGMATLDMLRQYDLTPANFLDTGGGISVAMLDGAVSMLLKEPTMKGIIVNLYGGINRMLDAAQGIAAALEKAEKPCPIAVKVLGNQQEEAWALLETLDNVSVFKDVQSEKAVAHLAKVLSVGGKA